MQVKCSATHYVILFIYICFNFFTMSFDLNDFPLSQELFKHVVLWQTVIGNRLPGFAGLWWDRHFMLSTCSNSASKSQWDGTCLVCFSPGRVWWISVEPILEPSNHFPEYSSMAIEYYRVLTNAVHAFLPAPALWTMSVKRESRSVTG